MSNAVSHACVTRTFHSGMKFDLRLHASGAKFHSGWNVRFGMKNGMNSIRNELQLNRDSRKQIQVSPLLFEQKWNEFDPCTEAKPAQFLVMQLQILNNYHYSFL